MKKKAKTSYIVLVLNGMAKGLFSSLIIGLIISQIGLLLNIKLLVDTGSVIKYMMGPAIGVGVAISVGAKTFGVIASLVAAAIGAGTVSLAGTMAIGDPVGALVGGVVAAEISKLVEGKTSFDLILVPFIAILGSSFISFTLSPFLTKAMLYTGEFINNLTTLHPIPMGILVSVVMGIILTLPISSAAIAISLGLSGLAAGASTVGCCCQMIGFAVISYKENGVSGLISQGLGTSMLQIGNIVKKPLIILPPVFASAILGPIATTVLRMENSPVGAGMGTSGLVGQISTLKVMGSDYIYAVVIMHFLLPALISAVFYVIMLKLNLIKSSDLKL